ncbi:hypothetical protein ACLMJK_001097 [Lecanora helva]
MRYYVAIAAVTSVVVSAVTAQSSVRNVDVAIIGGGVAGTYAAVRLHDQQKEVVVIEPKDYLGGNTETYTDPATNTSIDIGVQIFENVSIVLDYFGRFNIPLAETQAVIPSTTQYYDFTTGNSVPNPAFSSNPQDQAAAFARYAAQLAKYPYLSSGYYLPDPVPSDLLLPFGKFVQKYNLTATLPVISLYAEGFGDLVSIPTLYILRYIGPDFLNNTASNVILTTAAHNNSLLYTAAHSLLGPSVLLNSRVQSVSRPTQGRAIISVTTPTGIISIRAKRILVAFPQLLSNFIGWDLNTNERSVFSKFQSTGWYTGLLQNSTIPANLTLQNAGTNTAYNLPSLPAVYNFGPSAIPGLLHVYYGNIATYTIAEVQTAILNTANRLAGFGIIPKGGNAQLPILRSHTPYALRVGVQDIQDRFYDHLYALQGYRETYYTGAAFQVHATNAIWQYTDEVLRNLTVGL